MGDIQEPRAAAVGSARLRITGRESSRLSSRYYQQHYQLSTAFTIMHSGILSAQDSVQLASFFKLNTLKRAEISILHLFTDEKTFPNRQRSHFLFKKAANCSQ